MVPIEVFRDRIVGQTDSKPAKFIIFIPLLAIYSRLFHQIFCRIARDKKCSQRRGVNLSIVPMASLAGMAARLAILLKGEVDRGR